MHLDLPPSLVYTRGELLDELLENAFEASLLVDKNGTILFISERGARTAGGGLGKHELIGTHISGMHKDYSHFMRIIETGKARTNVFHQAANNTYLHSMYPIKWEKDTYAVLAVMTFRTFSSLKTTLAQLKIEDMDNSTREVYNLVARRELYTFADYIGDSPSIKKLLNECQAAANTDYPILILGETGTGKEILASAIHAASPYNSFHPFFRINCPAIPDNLMESELFGHEKGAFTGAVSARKGKFELAGAGSILLDEIGDMDMRLQAKLLRVLEAREFERLGGTQMLPMNARIITSTNADLTLLCQQRKFRSDLYYRLNTVELYVPPLRERPEDIPPLVRHFAALGNHQSVFDKAAIDELMRFDWPGNVRQLKNIVNRLDIMHKNDHITAEHVRLALRINQPASPFITPQTIRESERDAVIRALKDSDYRISSAAALLGISRPTLYRKLDKYGIQLHNNRTMAETPQQH